MNRRGFLERLRGAIIAAGVGGTVNFNQKEEAIWAGKVRIRHDEIDVSMKIPTSLNDVEGWARVGMGEDEIYELALQNLILKAQGKARGVFAHTGSEELTRDAVANYRLRRRA